MSLTDWAAAGWLVEHRPSQDETRALLGVIDRDLRDSAVAALSPDSQLGLAYNAALQAGTIALAALGYRASRERKHYITIQSLAVTIGADPAIVRRLDAFRKKRNCLVETERSATTVSRYRCVSHRVDAWLPVVPMLRLRKAAPGPRPARLTGDDRRGPID
jgi:hypothetical protein